MFVRNPSLSVGFGLILVYFGTGAIAVATVATQCGRAQRSATRRSATSQAGVTMKAVCPVSCVYEPTPVEWLRLAEGTNGGDAAGELGQGRPARWD